MRQSKIKSVVLISYVNTQVLQVPSLFFLITKNCKLEFIKFSKVKIQPLSPVLVYILTVLVSSPLA